MNQSPTSSSSQARPHPHDLVEFVEATNQQGGQYHRIDFGGGLVLEGEYDMARYVPSFGFPDDLDGKSVLDVGTSTGYVAVELARRGGDVTAIDLGAGGVQEHVFRGMNVDVRYVQMNLFELRPVHQFDLVFCGSVLAHTWDQFTALRRLRSVCKHQLILATPIMPSRWLLRRTPLARFVGIRVAAGTEEEYWTTWNPNACALVEMVRAAGFDDVEFRGSFRLRSEPGRGGHDALHGVVHGFVRS